MREFEVPALRDRQAREPVRSRARRHDRRRRTTARSRSDPTVRLRRRRRPEPSGRAPSSARGSRSSSSRCCSRPATTTTALARLREKPGTRDPRRPRAARLRPRRARPQARARRPARPGPRLGGRGPRGDGGRLRRRRPRPTGATCSSPGASASTSVSNAIVLAKDLRTVGIGAGQQSRVDAVRLALAKAARARPRARRRSAGLGCLLPVRGRPAGGARGRGDRGDPAGRLEARHGGDRGRAGGRRDDGAHGPAPLPPLSDDLALRPRCSAQLRRHRPRTGGLRSGRAAAPPRRAPARARAGHVARSGWRIPSPAVATDYARRGRQPHVVRQLRVGRPRHPRRARLRRRRREPLPGLRRGAGPRRRGTAG